MSVSSRSSRPAAGAAVAVTAFLLAGCSTATPVEESAVAETELDLSGVTLVVGEQTTEVSSYFLESGILDDLPYTVEFASFAAPADNLAANASDSVDLSVVAEWTGLQAAGNSKPEWTADSASFRNVYVGHQALPDEFDWSAAVVTSASGADSLADTKGGRWGFIPNSFWNLYAAAALDDLGWTEDDVEIVHLDIPSLRLALQTGEIDVSFVTTTTVTDLVADGSAKVVGHAENDLGLHFNTGLWANADALDDELKDAAIEDFIGRYVEYEQWRITHPDEVQEIAVSALNQTPQNALATWQYNRRLPVPVDEEVVDAAQSSLDVAASFGLVPEGLHADVFYDDRYADVVSAKLDELAFTDAIAESLDEGSAK